ncbi:MAG: OmpA family protein [Chitinophagaceae bacterium]|nr:OmpA family protein [Chitinophagaceae bacterium]MCW5905235.1 OmpA family protein [Chitinophagaceae bacterium]
MKKIFLLLVVISMTTASFAQSNKTDYKKRPTLSINFFMKDFVTPDRVGTTSLSSVLGNNQWAKLSEMYPGLGVTYLKGLSNHIDFASNLRGSFVKYPFLKGKTLNSEKFLLELDATVRLKLLTDKYTLVPYVSGGVGASMLGGSYFGAFMPFGGGFQVNLGGGDAFLFTDVSLNIPITHTTTNYNLNYSLGIGTPLVEKKVVEKPVEAPMPPKKVEPVDTDKDGIVDSLDKCPTVPGIAKYDGCPIPDTDNDGINDEEDKCPTVPGVAKYHGCPIPDTDKDGINDEEDKCPTVPGLARYQGCPIPDTDKDGVNDEEDKCPTIAGPASNQGCPIITEEKKKKVEMAAKNIYFATGKYTLLAKSYKSLDTVVALLNEKGNETLGIDIEGYTDNVGKAASNLKLSQSRANAVLAYFKKKGIDASRLSAKGYGPENPIGDNKTAAGRAMNRRVELKLIEIK